MSDTRSERREAERERQRQIEAQTKDIKQRLSERQDDGFKQAVMAAVEHIELEPHAYNHTALHMLNGCVDCVEANDPATAKLLLYISGAILSEPLTVQALNAIMASRERLRT